MLVPIAEGLGAVSFEHADIAVTELSESGQSFTGSGNGPRGLVSDGPDTRLIVELAYHSLIGNHDYGDRFWIEDADGTRAEIGHEQLIDLVLSIVAPICAQVFPDEQWDEQAIRAKLAQSISTTTQYLAQTRRPDRTADGGRMRTAEQAMRTGHPFHPIPKGTQWSSDDLARYAPELGTEFDLHWFALSDSALLEERVVDAPWVPDAVVKATPDGYSALPVHPWQADYLRGLQEAQNLLADGTLVDLGELGPSVYPTSSVRTVCSPEHEIMWKLPLHIRVTNSLRVNPLPEMRRAADAARLITEIAPSWPEEFQVLVETGFRTIDPAIGSAGLVADLGVLFRRNPFIGNGLTPQVLSGLLDEAPGIRPLLLDEVERAGGDHREWLRRYLAVSLVPMLEIYDRDALSFEAHVQNCLIEFEDGWPTQTWVRDFEGTSVSRERGIGRDLKRSSPLSGYTDREVWLRLVYHVVTNQVGHVIYALARFGPHSEHELWETTRDLLAELDSPAARMLLTSRTLPAKGNLVTGFARPGVLPLYVDIANPLNPASVSTTTSERGGIGAAAQ
ncbi:IucA/IucC family protein [Tsukamurella ocularis]|uniref:IucA/IucC family protein n=1 Tax=Tsukamurella ocularis TaxID=1970234 RepID=UPI0021689749|nr:IucA/IucC family protein [Tsukamurella ocularis]MCS3780418.1 siderophore synthetase component [Tsukamurella ocularis]MCS3786027.1 siderophore synthetase component [Tsukamurella ocularis]MCS3849391.1 siderophore synthetase component [Tsukamurella ocularis]